MRRRLALVFAAVMWQALPPLASAEPAQQALRGKRITDAVLATQRGGADTASGVVAGNQAINTVTGSNSITAGALAGASGVPVVIQNSGNNVLIQSSVTVNVQLK